MSCFVQYAMSINQTSIDRSIDQSEDSSFDSHSLVDQENFLLSLNLKQVAKEPIPNSYDPDISMISNACNVCGLSKGYFCPVVVHQECYGVSKLSKGDKWLCSKCKLMETRIDVSCELCPNKDGAFKPTNRNSFVHVICCLYTPGTEFGNEKTMEPVILDSFKFIKRECYICKDQGRITESTFGSCINCNHNKCDKFFHVTCAQADGLLIEEVFGKKRHLKFYANCKDHQKSIKRNRNISKMPPFRPTKRKFFDFQGVKQEEDEKKPKVVKVNCDKIEDSYPKVIDKRNDTKNEMNDTKYSQDSSQLYDDKIDKSFERNDETNLDELNESDAVFDNKNILNETEEVILNKDKSHEDKLKESKSIKPEKRHSDKSNHLLDILNFSYFDPKFNQFIKQEGPHTLDYDLKFTSEYQEILLNGSKYKNYDELIEQTLIKSNYTPLEIDTSDVPSDLFQMDLKFKSDYEILTSNSENNELKRN